MFVNASQVIHWSLNTVQQCCRDVITRNDINLFFIDDVAVLQLLDIKLKTSHYKFNIHPPSLSLSLSLSLFIYIYVYTRKMFQQWQN